MPAVNDVGDPCAGNRTHRSTGGSWKPSTPATDTEENAPAGNHPGPQGGHRGAATYRQERPPRQLPPLHQG